MAAAVKKTVNAEEEKNKRRMSLEAFQDQAIEAQSWLAPYILEAGDEEFVVPHPIMMDDETRSRLAAAEADEDLDRDEDGQIVSPPKIDGRVVDWHIRSARAILGPDKHARFVAANGKSSYVTLAWQMLSREQQEVVESDPK
jgi:hypothetical protein